VLRNFLSPVISTLLSLPPLFLSSSFTESLSIF
jgi:hypothetical protein